MSQTTPTTLTVGTLSDWQELPSEPKAHCDIIELRLDLIPQHQDSHAKARQLSEHIPLLITARDPAEGGNPNNPNTLTLSQRISLLTQHLPHASYLDLELRHAKNPQAENLLLQARAAGSTLILSHHDFENFQPEKLTTLIPEVCQLLRNMPDSSAKPSPAILKIASHLHHHTELSPLINLLEQSNSQNLPMALMGMGPLGPASRLLAAHYGSRLVYGYLGNKPNAPGQTSARDLKHLLNQTHNPTTQPFAHPE